MPRTPPRDRLADRLSRLPFRPLLFSSPDLLYGETRLRRLELHRHLRLSPKLQPHDHRYAQILLYLSGHGEIQLGSATAPITPGSLVAAPPGLAHSFRRTSPRPPLCLVVEGSFPNLQPAIVRAPGLTLHQLRSLLHRLAALRESPDPAPQTEAAGICLQILGLLLATLAPSLQPTTPPQPGALAHRLRRALASDGSLNLSITELARRLGYHPDYLTRRLKLETGQTARQLRDTARHRLVVEALAKNWSIDRVSAAAGFSDPAHFIRWFRQHHGQTPGSFQRQLRASGLHPPLSSTQHLAKPRQPD